MIATPARAPMTMPAIAPPLSPPPPPPAGAAATSLPEGVPLQRCKLSHRCCEMRCYEGAQQKGPAARCCQVLRPPPRCRGGPQQCRQTRKASHGMMVPVFGLKVACPSSGSAAVPSSVWFRVYCTAAGHSSAPEMGTAGWLDQRCSRDRRGLSGVRYKGITVGSRRSWCRSGRCRSWPGRWPWSSAGRRCFW